MPNSAGKASLFFARHQFGPVNQGGRNMGQFGHVLPNVLSGRIKSLRLASGAEDTKAGHGVRAGGGAPLPVAVIGGGVAVYQVLQEVLFA